MPMQYVKRLQMAFDFAHTPVVAPELPLGYRFVPWTPDLLEIHADVKHRGFRDDFDALIFPTFRQYDRCLRLMESIASSPAFLPGATLLIACDDGTGLFAYAANIQGMRLSGDVGAIQNVAVLPEFRQRGLGRAMVLGSLRGFRDAGVERVTLEVTADNVPAVKLYDRIGFKVFKAYFRETRREP